MNIKKIILGTSALALSFAFLAVTTFAETLGPIDFESYNLGSVSGQDGWSNAVNPAYDQEVVSNTYSIPSFGTKTFRISDAVTSGSFGDWVFVKPLTDSVGETSATNGSFSTGTKQTHFEMQFDIASTTPNSQQPGLHISVSPDRGDGSRMSYLRFDDLGDGIHVMFDDVTNPGPVGTVSIFNETDIATISRGAHTIKLTMDVVDGPSNDVVKVYVDGVLEHTGKSWEDYYRFDPESNAEQSPRIVKTMIIQARGESHEANDGNGFLLDNISLSSGPTPTVTLTPTPTTNPFAVPAECSGITGLGAPIVGTNGGNVINGTNGNDLIFALGGSDIVNGKNGDDCIVGGDGSDILNGDNGQDVILGGDGSDSIKGDNQDDKLYGQDGSDSVSGGNGDDSIWGGAGSDSLKGDTGKDTLDGQGGSDAANGGTGNQDKCTAEARTQCEL